MNLSTSASINILKKSASRPLATVSWWHLVADQSRLTSSDIGITIVPSLGSSNDREMLVEDVINENINWSDFDLGEEYEYKNGSFYLLFQANG